MTTKISVSPLIDETVSAIGALDETAMGAARARQKTLTKPEGSLGVLEEMSVRLAGITGRALPGIGDKVIMVMAGDHGVTAEGVSAYPSEVTPQMVLNFVSGGAAINVLARHVGARVVVADLGVALPVEHPEVLQLKVRPGTANFTAEPAMSREEAISCLETGIRLAREQIDNGDTIIGLGDMGIGNTAASSAILAALSSYGVNQVVGRGTGVEQDGLERKRRAISKALALHRPDPNDPIDVLCKVGGLEIGGLAGCVLGAAAARIPVVVDGFIAGAAALLAARICPESAKYMFASHLSGEPGHRLILDLLGLQPALYLGMRLGEGTGAALAMQLLEAACRLLAEMATFQEAGVSTKGEI